MSLLAEEELDLQQKKQFFVKLFVSLLKSDVPRQVSRDHVGSVVMIMDACYEEDSGDRVCGLGGTLVDSIRGVRLFFSCALDEDSVVCWEKRKSNK